MARVFTEARVSGCVVPIKGGCRSCMGKHRILGFRVWHVSFRVRR